MEVLVMEAYARVQRGMIPWIIFSNFLHKIYVQRGLIRNLVARDLRARYIGSFIGFFWSVIHPIVLLVSYTFVFSVIFKHRPLADAGTTSFSIFLFCGILPWLFFQDTLLRSCTSIIDHSNLITKTLFPSEVLPLTISLAGLVNHLVGLVILFVILLFTLEKISIFILLIPVYFLVLMLFTLGVAWFVSSLNVFVRDISQVLSVILTFWFWFTPIIYSPELFPRNMLFIVRWNPMAHIVNGYRDCLLRMSMPDLKALSILAILSLLIFAGGGLFFRHTKREFVDVL